MMEAVSISEVPVKFCQSKRRYIPEDSHFRGYSNGTHDYYEAKHRVIHKNVI
jgi:hypothetical protein